jgi:sulfate transport system ATP-binding protein
MMSVVLRNVEKSFGSFRAVDNVSLDVPDGSLVVLLGPSGSGKTTLLRIIAGLEVADSGSIIQHDEDVTRYSARERNVGFVFQHYALFRHMTIADNVGYALRVRGVPKREREARVNELLKLIRLEGYGPRYPAQLSGGERQRVALARALAARPRVLLLDEPFGALDAKIRQELRLWLRRLHHDMRTTSLFVTHDQDEAFEIADRVVIMNQGRIEQSGTPAEVFEHPANPFVMGFLGTVNVFPGAQAAYVRPHELVIHHTPNGASSLQALVHHLHPAGSQIKVELRAIGSDQLISAELTPERVAELNLSPGDTVYVTPRRVRVFG